MSIAYMMLSLYWVFSVCVIDCSRFFLSFVELSKRWSQMKRIISWYVNHVIMFRFLLIDSLIKLWFSDVFRECRKRPVVWNGLMFCSSVLLAFFYVWILLLCEFASCLLFYFALWKTSEDSGSGFVFPRECKCEDLRPNCWGLQHVFWSLDVRKFATNVTLFVTLLEGSSNNFLKVEGLCINLRWDLPVPSQHKSIKTLEESVNDVISTMSFWWCLYC